MQNSKRIIILIILFIAIVCSVSAIVLLLTTNDSSPKPALQQQTPQPSLETEHITATPTPTTTPVPEKPKYIFYVIGDGMGFSHLALGDAYEKVLHEDSSYSAYWDSFEVKKSCVGARESAGGGTMIAAGYNGAENVISLDAGGNRLVTILDRAEEMGFATGVISNSYIFDATPAAFLAHAAYRGEYLDIANQIPFSGVDYIAGGGMNYFLNEAYRHKYGEVDVSGNEYLYSGDENVLSMFEENGYSVFLGEEGAFFFSGDEYNPRGVQKIFTLFTATNNSYQHSRYDSRIKKYDVREPDLADMTRKGIEVLSQNENGFVFVIEQALIDKASHNLWVQYTAAEMHLLHNTLGVILEFYEKHPFETLVLLTSDHETGNMTYNSEFAENLSELPDINWHKNGGEIYDFLSEKWGLELSEEKIEEKNELGRMGIWESEDRNYTELHSYIAANVCEANGISITSNYHSDQKIPLYALGVKSDYFAQCEYIYSISQLVCEIMGWKPLPETIQ